MLLDDFFTIAQTTISDSEIKAEVKLNSQHGIFRGHFPQEPIVPGVCQIQMVEEILFYATRRKFLLQRNSYSKFLLPVNPVVSNAMHVELKLEKKEEKGLTVTAAYHWNGQPVFKFKGIFCE